MRIIATLVLSASVVMGAGCEGRSGSGDDAQLRAEIEALRAEIAARAELDRQAQMKALRAEIAAQAELDRQAAARSAYQEQMHMAWQARQQQMQRDMERQAAEQRRAVDEAIRRAHRRGLSHGFR